MLAAIMNFFFLFVFVGVQCAQRPARKECNDPDKFPCENGECVPRYAWCDAAVDCTDGSDERFCRGVRCLDSHFQCEDGRCIPVSGVCDKYSDCMDGSDEANCEASKGPEGITEMYSDGIPPTLDEATERAFVKAAKYFLSKMTEEDGWGEFTPRAVVALSFADKVSPITQEERELMEKQLNVHLMADLIRKEGKQSLSTLALYINALYATCQEPRDFQGMNLVDILRSEVDIGTKSNLSFPVVFLTLCIADKINQNDLHNLTDIYRQARSDRTGIRAIVIMAMACIARKTNRDVESYVKHFFSENVRNADIYTKALFFQAAVATNSSVSFEDLKEYQLPDGSFGDMLATYNAIPTLLHSSLLEIRCSTRRHEGAKVGNQLKGIAGNKIVYSLWITRDEGINKTHLMTIPFEGNTTFYDIMKMAASKDSLYSFLYDETNEGKKVYSLAGMPNDVEAGRSWILYEGDVDTVALNSDEYMTEMKIGVDRIFPKDKNHYVFWFTR